MPYINLNYIRTLLSLFIFSQSAEAELVSPSETWNNAQWTDPAVNRPNATYVRGTTSTSTREHRLAAPQNSNDSLGGWEDGEFEPIEEDVDGEYIHTYRYFSIKIELISHLNRVYLCFSVSRSLSQTFNFINIKPF